MNKFKKSQILMLFGLTALLVLTPLLSSSLRPTYLYFIFNLLIIALGAEAGLLSAFPKPSEEKKQSLSTASKASTTSETSAASYKGVAESSVKKQKVVEKSHSDKVPGNVRMEPLKKCPSTSSIFFIGEGEAEAEEMAEEHGEVEEEVGGGVLNGQELFTQAEIFIGNFYRQLKMQKEESWKNIHGFYQKGF